jgi:hypothetical protein
MADTFEAGQIVEIATETPAGSLVFAAGGVEKAQLSGVSTAAGRCA